MGQSEIVSEILFASQRVKCGINRREINGSQRKSLIMSMPTRECHRVVSCNDLILLQSEREQVLKAREAVIIAFKIVSGLKTQYLTCYYEDIKQIPHKPSSFLQRESLSIKSTVTATVIN